MSVLKEAFVIAFSIFWSTAYLLFLSSVGSDGQ